MLILNCYLSFRKKKIISWQSLHVCVCVCVVGRCFQVNLNSFEKLCPFSEEKIFVLEILT